jgi:hypothetical protein
VVENGRVELHSDKLFADPTPSSPAVQSMGDVSCFGAAAPQAPAVADSGLSVVTTFWKGQGPAVGAEAQQGSMVWLDLEANLPIDAADQGGQDAHRDIDQGLAVGALQMGMGSRSGLVRRLGHRKVVNRGGAADVRVGDEPELTECGQSAIDGRPVDSRSRCLGASDDLIGSQMLMGAVQNLDDSLTSSGHALVLVAKQAQGGLDAGR